jgi:hypothetical protein
MFLFQIGKRFEIKTKNVEQKRLFQRSLTS